MSLPTFFGQNIPGDVDGHGDIFYQRSFGTFEVVLDHNEGTWKAMVTGLSRHNLFEAKYVNKDQDAAMRGLEASLRDLMPALWKLGTSK